MPQVMSCLLFFNYFSDFAYKRIDLVTGGVIVIGVVTGDQCFICCSPLYIVVCPFSNEFKSRF